MPSPKIAIILGTRPEIIKMSPVIRALEKIGADYFVLHTGQHYSYNMDRVFFEQLELPEARYNLDVGSGSHAEQTAKMLLGIERVLLKEKTEIVLVEGDTNSVFSGALTAAKLQIGIGHVEAGLRSYDRTMPEEVNRVLADHMADYLFAPTENARGILLGEGIPAQRIYMTGNTIVDAVFQNLELAKSKIDSLKDFNLQPHRFALVTIHRPENVDDLKRFSSIIQAIDILQPELKMPVIYPIHPRSRKMMSQFSLTTRHATLIDPVDFLGFLQLESNAAIILTDSGGVQEEACILKVPCVTLRHNTERPETIEIGSNIIAGTSPEKIVECVHTMLNRTRDWQNPFGDGAAGEKIVKIITGVNNG